MTKHRPIQIYIIVLSNSNILLKWFVSSRFSLKSIKSIKGLHPYIRRKEKDYGWIITTFLTTKIFKSLNKVLKFSILDSNNFSLASMVYLNKNIRYKARFVEATASGINFNFIEFSEADRGKYISGKFQEYYKGFIEFMRPLLLDFIKEIKYNGYPFNITILFVQERYIHILTIQDNETK